MTSDELEDFVAEFIDGYEGAELDDDEDIKLCGDLRLSHMREIKKQLRTLNLVRGWLFEKPERTDD